MVQCIGLQRRFKIYLSDYSSTIYYPNFVNSANSNSALLGNSDSFIESNVNKRLSNSPNRNYCKTPDCHKRQLTQTQTQTQTQNNPELFLFLNQNRNKLVESMMIRHNNSKFPRRSSLNQVNSQTSADLNEFFKISKLDHKSSCIYPSKNSTTNKTNPNRPNTADISTNGTNGINGTNGTNGINGRNKNKRKYIKNSLDSRNMKGNKNQSFNCLRKNKRIRHSEIFITGMQFGGKKYLSKLENFAKRIQKKLKDSLLKINNHNGLKTNYIPYKDLIQFKEKTKRQIDINKMLICKNATFNYRGTKESSKDNNINKAKSRKSNDSSLNFKNKTLNIIHCLIPTAVINHQE